MATFYADVIARLHDEELKKLDNLKGTANIDVKLGGEGADLINGNMRNLTAKLGTTGSKAGQSFGEQFNRGFQVASKSPKLKGGILDDYFNRQAKQGKRAVEIDKQYADRIAENKVEASKESIAAAKYEEREKQKIRQQAAKEEQALNKKVLQENVAAAKEQAKQEQQNQRTIDRLRREGQKQAEKVAKDRDEYSGWWSNALDQRDLQQRQSASKEQERLIRQEAQARSDYENWWSNALNQRDLQQRNNLNKAVDSYDRAKTTMSSFGDIMDKNSESYKKYNGSRAFQNFIDNANKAQSSMNDLDAQIKKGEITDSSSMKNVNSNITAASKAYEKLTKPITELERVTAQNNVGAWLKNNSKVAKNQNLYDAIRGVQRQLGNENLDFGQQQALLSQFKNYQSQAAVQGLTGRSWWDDFKRATGQIFQFTGVYGALQGLTQQLPRQMIQSVYDVDTAMTELRKVSEASPTQITSYFDTAAESAQKYGVTISDIISSTADFSRLGYTLPQSSELAEVANMYKNVGDGIDIDDATSSIVSTMKAFNIESDNAISIVDKFNEVGKRIA